MSEKQETDEQAAERLGLLVYKGSVSFTKAIEVIQSLEAQVAKLQAERDEARPNLQGSGPLLTGLEERRLDHWAMIPDDAPNDDGAASMGRMAREILFLRAKHQGGGDE